MTTLLVFGPPGSGKGTTAKLYAEHSQLKHVSSGDLFRTHVQKETALGKRITTLLDQGKLVDDATTCTLVMNYIKEYENIILDGFPRTLSQAKMLLEKRSVQGVIIIELDNESIIARISKRRVCPKDATNYHLHFNPPKQTGVCDVCQSALVQRDDDKEVTVRKRLQEYHSVTWPVVMWLENQDIPIIKISGDFDLRTESEDVINQIDAWQKTVE